MVDSGGSGDAYRWFIGISHGAQPLVTRVPHSVSANWDVVAIPRDYGSHVALFAEIGTWDHDGNCPDIRRGCTSCGAIAFHQSVPASQPRYAFLLRRHLCRTGQLVGFSG